MIYGIGIDIVQIAKLKRVIDKWGDRFLNRVFTTGEITYAKGKSNPQESLAARFAAKEALFKAIGRSLIWKEVEVINQKSGKPEMRLTGMSSQAKRERRISNIHLSMSHHGEYAVAEVILER